MSLPNIKLTGAAKAESSPLRIPPAPATDGGKSRLPVDDKSALKSTRVERVEDWIYDLSSGDDGEEGEEEEEDSGGSAGGSHSGVSVISRGRQRERGARPPKPQQDGGHFKPPAIPNPQQGGKARVVPIFIIGPDSSKDEASTENGSGQAGEEKEDGEHDLLSNLSLY